MESLLRKLETFNEVDFADVERALVGECCDDRGEEVRRYLAAAGIRASNVKYNPEEMSVFIDGEKVVNDADFSGDFGVGSIVVDATTLGVAELVPIFRLLMAGSQPNIKILYVEPALYRRASESVVTRRDFEITRVREKFQPIPGHSYALRPNKHTVVFLAGFEGERIVQAFEEHPLDPRKCAVVFGVPAYRCGWEMDAFANHVGELGESGIKGRVQFAPADNPIATFRLLERVYQSRSPEQRMFVAPLGTKPQAVGAAHFLATYPDVGLLFDHPVTIDRRTSGIGSAHLFEYGLSL